MMQWHMRQRDPGDPGRGDLGSFTLMTFMFGSSNSHHIWRLDRYIAGLLEATLLERRDVRKLRFAPHLMRFFHELSKLWGSGYVKIDIEHY